MFGVVGKKTYSGQAERYGLVSKNKADTQLLVYGYSYIMLAMAVQRRFSALQNDANIAQFLVEGHFVGRELGTGSYGSVEEVR